MADARSWSIAETAARDARGRLVAVLARQIGSLAAAEDALSEAFSRALETWPRSGIPDSPEAWLLSVARRKHIDGVRRNNVALAAEAEIERQLDERTQTSTGDQRLSLLFVCAHPAIDEAMRAPLMLQVVLGLSADAIAPLWLMTPAAMAQRLVRAKSKIRNAGIAFSIPDTDQCPERLNAVLDTIYAALTVGGSDASLALEAEYLAALVAAAFPQEAEALGLCALCLYRVALSNENSDARLDQQQPPAWDRERIARAEAFLHRAAKRLKPGRFQLEAAIQSAHIAGR